MPPHSPEYNLIEKTWAHIKKHLKKSLGQKDFDFRNSLL
ncbi:transposase [Streptococcus hohhotensis]